MSVSVLRLEVVFSTIENGAPGLTSVILKKVWPRSKPRTLAVAAVARSAAAQMRFFINLI